MINLLIIFVLHFVKNTIYLQSVNKVIHMNGRTINPYVSVDCVLLGFDGDKLNVLLVRQCDVGVDNVTEYYKLPGSLIYMDEDLDDAAKRVLKELTGLVQVDMTQFKAFGSANRLANPKDTVWLERFHRLDHHLERIVTVAYLSLLRIGRKHSNLEHMYEACWVAVDNLPQLAFDHSDIVDEALLKVRGMAVSSPVKLFELLPRKFTIAQLHVLYETIMGRSIDLRNFHKKVQSMPYVIPLDEKEQGVNHRAARFYRFVKANV